MADVSSKVYAALGGEPSLARYVLPLLIDCIAASAAPPPPLSSTARAAGSVSLRPDVFASLASSLADVGATCAAAPHRPGYHDGHDSLWAFEQVRGRVVSPQPTIPYAIRPSTTVVSSQAHAPAHAQVCDVLLRAFRDNVRGAYQQATAASPELSFVAHPHERAPALATAITRLAARMHGGGAGSHIAARLLRNRLLATLNDTVLSLTSRAAPVVAMLLPALAEACRQGPGLGSPLGAEGSGSASLGVGAAAALSSVAGHASLSRSRMSYADLGKVEQDEGSSIKVRVVLSVSDH
jgi:hypothetical protein